MLMRSLVRATGLAWTIAASLPGPARAAPPAPAAWIDYAQTLGERLRARLAQADDPAAARLHGFLNDQVVRHPRHDPPRVILRVWLDRAGQVSRARFDLLGDSRADGDLRSLVLGLAVGNPPPPDMPQPVALRIALAIAD